MRRASSIHSSLAPSTFSDSLPLPLVFIPLFSPFIYGIFVSESQGNLRSNRSHVGKHQALRRGKQTPPVGRHLGNE